MAIQQNIGSDPVYFSGDALVLQVTVQDQDGNVLDLSTLPLSEATWAIAKEQGKTPLLSKTLGDGVEVVNPPGVDGRLDITIENADTAALKGTYYHELQLEPGPLTAMYGDFIIQIDSISP